MTTIHERIAMLIKALELNKNSFSVRIGVDSTVIHNIVGGRYTKPSFDLLEKIILSFDNINLRWLILGEGEKVFIDKDAQVIAQVNAQVKGKKLSVAEDSAEYGNKLELIQRVKELEAQNEALYRAFREIGKGLPK